MSKRLLSCCHLICTPTCLTILSAGRHLILINRNFFLRCGGCPFAFAASPKAALHFLLQDQSSPLNKGEGSVLMTNVVVCLWPASTRHQVITLELITVLSCMHRSLNIFDHIKKGRDNNLMTMNWYRNKIATVFTQHSLKHALKQCQVQRLQLCRSGVFKTYHMEHGGCRL